MAESDETKVQSVSEMIINISQDHVDITELDFVRNSKPGELNVSKIGHHGYVNDIWKIASDGNKEHVVIKKAFPYMKRMGPSHPTPQGRNLIEFQALMKMKSIIPNNVVVPYCYSKQYNAFAMEYLCGYENLKSQLINGKVDKVALDKLGTALGKMHSQTNSANLTPGDFDQLKTEFDNTEMCEIMKRYIFEKPYDKEDKDNLVKSGLQKQVGQMLSDQNLLQNVDKFKNIYQEKKECLIHGDLHTGSVMVSKENNPKMFDLEFSFVGPPSFDLGFLMAHMLMAYYQHQLTEENNDMHRQVMYKISEACTKMVESYFDARGNLTKEYKEEFIQEVAGFAACEIFFRIIGCGESENISHSESMERDTLGCGLRLMKQHLKIKSFGTMLFIGLQLC